MVSVLKVENRSLFEHSYDYLDNSNQFKINFYSIGLLM